MSQRACTKRGRASHSRSWASIPTVMAGRTGVPRPHVVNVFAELGERTIGVGPEIRRETPDVGNDFRELGKRTYSGGPRIPGPERNDLSPWIYGRWLPIQ